MTTPSGDATPAFMTMTLLRRASGETRVSIERPVGRALADGLRLHLIPPGANPGHPIVVAVHHLHRLAEALVGIGETQRARLVLVFFRQPGAVVAPHAWAFLALVGLPVRNVDVASAPAVLHHEVRRRPRIERRDEIAGVAAERGGDTVLALGDVVA